jgi:CheY-like chemotaxis protein
MTSTKLKGLKILVAEDDQDLRECISENLTLCGASVITAENGKVAYELCLKEKVDVVLSDFRMPGGDGLTLLRALRAKDAGHPPFVFLSGYSDLATEEIMREGAQAFLHKPCDFNEIAAHLLTIVKG